MPDCGPKVAPGWVPEWIFCPRDRILSVVVEWIVAGFETVSVTFADAVAAVFGSLGLAGSTAGNAVVSAGRLVGNTLFGVAGMVNSAILDVAMSSGPVAPFVVVALYAGVGAVFVVSLVAVRKGVLWIT